MTECNSLNDQQQFKLSKINEIKDYFIVKIKEKELMNKRISKYILFFNYFDKLLIALSAANVNISIASFETVIEAPAGIASAIFSFAFLILIGIVKKL